MDVLLQAVSSVGFPIAVAIWAMMMSRKDREWLQDTLSKELEGMTAAMHQMAAAVDDVSDKIKEIVK